MNGYAGKIVRINLTDRNIRYIDTRDYEKWGGGHGIGSALFYDIAMKEKGMNLAKMDHNSPNDGGFHPDNVLTLMTSPLVASGVPAASGRTEVQGIGVQPYPIGWFTRSNFGGRFSAQLKFAGYDGIVIEGAASEPVWIDIRNSDIKIHPCKDLGLWGMDTVVTQETIWNYVAGNESYGSWISPAEADLITTQRPAVLTIGKAGENKSRMACLIHDASNAAGQGGFGGIWGSKNLKAISAIGTGSVSVADPAKLISLRIWMKENYEFNPKSPSLSGLRGSTLRHNAGPGPADLWGITPIRHLHHKETAFKALRGMGRREEGRPQSCIGCHAGCRGRFKSGKANEANCMATVFYGDADTQKIQIEAVDLANRYGFNTYELYQGLPYLKAMSDKGVIGPKGSEIETKLDFSDYGSLAFAKRFLKTIADRDTPFGDALSEGFPRALEKWGRLGDIGDCAPDDPSHVMLPYWGYPEHDYDSRAELEWGYGSILGDRDINEHGINSIYWNALSIVPGSEFARSNRMLEGLIPQRLSAKDSVAIFTEKMVPHVDAYKTKEEGMQMLNYATENMYSEHIARMVSWHRHYTRFFKESLLFCDWKWPDIINTKRKDAKGSTPVSESAFIKAVTGKDLSFEEGMKIGRKIWNLDNAIWVLQGRHRDMVHFADYIYQNPFPGTYHMPTYDPNVESPDEQWDFREVGNRNIDRKEFEKFKTRFYKIEGWNPKTGWPTKKTLESLGLEDVARTMKRLGKI